MNNIVYALTVYNNELIAGGAFTTARGVNANRIAKWNGTVWSPLGSGMNNIVYALTVYNNELIAGGAFTTAGGVSAYYIAKWNGSAWAPVGSGMNDAVYSLTVYNNELIAGGVFTTAGGASANYIAKWNGTNWAPLGSGMNDFVRALTIYNNELIAAGSFTTAGGAIANRIAKWFSPSVIKTISNEIPKSFALSQNYPNPFNPTTKIQFSLPEKSFTTLIIYDCLGKQIATLVNEQLNAGSYKADFNGSNLNSGLYFYKLTAGDFTQTKKMILVK